MAARLKKRLTRHFLFLGKTGPTFNCYKVRFRITRKTPTFSELCRSSSDCLRSRDNEERRACRWLAGRGVLFALHVVVLVFGAVDLCLDLRTSNSTAHLTMATIAVVTMTLQVALRVVSIQTYRIKTISRDLSLSVDGNDLLVELTRMHSTFRKILTFIGLLAILINVVLFPLFYLFLHLGWAHISNNLLVMCFGSVHEVLQSVLEREIAITDEDSNKAVLHEAAQILQEQFCLRSIEERVVYEDRVNRFLIALRNTPCYFRPDYMRLEEINLRPISSSSSYTEEEPGTPEEHLSCI